VIGRRICDQMNSGSVVWPGPATSWVMVKSSKETMKARAAPAVMPGMSSGSMPGMDSGTMPGMDGGAMPGMMSAEDMKNLEQAKGAQFDKMWLDMMIKHHQGAIDMAKTELSKGGNADAKALAQKIIDAQQGEITEMQGLSSKS